MTVLLFLMLFLPYTIHSLNAEGQACHNVGRNLTGTCKILQECPSIIEDIIAQERNLIFLQECGLATTQPIVCCPHEVVGSRSRAKCLKYSKKHPVKCPSEEGGGAEEFPHMVRSACRHLNTAQARFNDGRTNERRYLCAGSLISDRFVLTALSCLNLPGFVGPEVAILANGSLEMEVLETFKSPHKQGLALVELKKSVDVKPVCLFLNKAKSEQEHRVLASWSFDEFNVVGNITKRKCVYSSNNGKTALCSRPTPLLWQADLGSPIHIRDEQVDCAYSLYGVVTSNSTVVKRIQWFLRSFSKIETIAEILHNAPVIFKFAHVEPNLQWIESVVWP